MYHLIKFRNGWQSEHLARFIISKFAFIAEPSSVADDIGSDFFCTNFDIMPKGYLLPQKSFAIQIKSDKRKIDITNKLNYLQNIEFPFFVGVINKKKKLLTIYSGEAIPHFFSKYGNPLELKNLYNNPKANIRLVDNREKENLFNRLPNETFEMVFYKIVDIPVDFEYDKAYLSDFYSAIQIIQKNISAWKSDEYLFKLVGTNKIEIYTGPGSIQTYKENFINRLTEVFWNLNWIHNSINFSLDLAEFTAYENVYKTLLDLYKDDSIPDTLIEAYNTCKKNAFS